MKMFKCPECGTEMVLYSALRVHCPGCGIICRAKIDTARKAVTLTMLRDVTLEDLGSPVEQRLMVGQVMDDEGRPSSEPFVINAADPDPIEEFNRRHPHGLEMCDGWWEPLADHFGISVEDCKRMMDAWNRWDGKDPAALPKPSDYPSWKKSGINKEE